MPGKSPADRPWPGRRAGRLSHFEDGGVLFGDTGPGSRVPGVIRSPLVHSALRMVSVAPLTRASHVARCAPCAFMRTSRDARPAARDAGSTPRRIRSRRSRHGTRAAEAKCLARHKLGCVREMVSGARRRGPSIGRQGLPRAGPTVSRAHRMGSRARQPPSRHPGASRAHHTPRRGLIVRCRSACRSSRAGCGTSFASEGSRPAGGRVPRRSVIIHVHRTAPDHRAGSGEGQGPSYGTGGTQT